MEHTPVKWTCKVSRKESRGALSSQPGSAQVKGLQQHCPAWLQLVGTVPTARNPGAHTGIAGSVAVQVTCTGRSQLEGSHLPPRPVFRLLSLGHLRWPATNLASPGNKWAGQVKEEIGVSCSQVKTGSPYCTWLGACPGACRGRGLQPAELVHLGAQPQGHWHPSGFTARAL